MTFKIEPNDCSCQTILYFCIAKNDLKCHFFYIWDFYLIRESQKLTLFSGPFFGPFLNNCHLTLIENCKNTSLYVSLKYSVLHKLILSWFAFKLLQHLKNGLMHLPKKWLVSLFPGKQQKERYRDFLLRTCQLQAEDLITKKDSSFNLFFFELTILPDNNEYINFRGRCCH